MVYSVNLLIMLPVYCCSLIPNRVISKYLLCQSILLLLTISSSFQLCSSKQSSSDVSPLQKIVSMAVKDIADVDEQNRSTESSRFLRFIFPLIGSSIPFETLVNYLYACASGETEAVQSIPENEYSKPSLSEFAYFTIDTLI